MDAKWLRGDKLGVLGVLVGGAVLTARGESALLSVEITRLAGGSSPRERLVEA